MGTKVVSERPSDAARRVDYAAAPGWFVLKDRSALNGSDIVDPEQSYGTLNEPIVTFGFTRSGRAAFARILRSGALPLDLALLRVRGAD